MRPLLHHRLSSRTLPPTQGGTFGTVLCKLLTGGGLGWIAATSSIVTLVAIAAERYFMAIYPAGNVGKLTKGKLKVSHLQSSIITISELVKVQLRPYTTIK